MAARAVAAVAAVRATDRQKEASPQWLASFFALDKSRAKKSPQGACGLKGCSLGAESTIGGSL
ncbi:hypothetical protein CQZ99_11755 [Pseudomonas poae]|uniref:Uncharacterized protein n=1 Tax=Pseudomonas poae TaxID=200451 RepID=A0A2S9ET46_9PSED|nr:hypothetical protein CQZ99_11755 [Pseudomonas poae]